MSIYSIYIFFFLEQGFFDIVKYRMLNYKSNSKTCHYDIFFMHRYTKIISII